jgi:hypothetical protein
MTMRTSERGVALVMTLLAILLLSAIGAALVLATNTDASIASNTGASAEAFYAADAVFQRTVAELRTVPDFNAVLSGASSSAFTDGSATGPRTLAGGITVDLAQAVNLANCAKPAGCSAADLNASLRDRPWGARNPRWRLFSYGPLDSPAASGWSGRPVYVVSMVADDPRDDDGDPSRDGVRTGTTMNPGAGVLLVRGEAFGARGAHRVVEGAVVRQDLVTRAVWDAADPATRGSPPAERPVLRVVAWRELR